MPLDTYSVNSIAVPAAGAPNAILFDSTGNQPDVNKDTLESQRRTISSVDQAFTVCETLVNDWKRGLVNSSRISAKFNGERPWNQAKLKQGGKDWKSNISTGFLTTECAKVYPRLYMPLKTAKYLTAASLPADWPDGDTKTRHFRECVTETIRAWKKFNFYIRGLAREVSAFGFGFNFWPDQYEWRPTLMRMDRGFVPQGTEIMEEPFFFMAKIDYKPHELMTLLRNNLEAGRDEWKKDAVVAAVNGASPPPVDASYPQARQYEDLVRQATWGFSYAKGVKLIRTYHLFSKEVDGRVSHYVLWYDGQAAGDSRLLYENLDEFSSMDDVVNACVFEFGDGTIHGSWGAGQILYDLSVQVEKIRNDAIDNMRMTNKMKIQVPEAKNINDVKLTVNDTFMLVSGAQFSGNTAGIPQDINGYNLLDEKLVMLAQQKIGAFVPPIPLQPSDIKAAQINAAMSQEKELQDAMLENWLMQWSAGPMRTMTKRLCNPDSPDSDAQKLLQKLQQKLNMQEILMMVDQNPTQSVMDFTEYATNKRSAFASTVVNNPLFNQGVVARSMAAGAGDEAFIDSIVVKDGDQSAQLEAARQQMTENAAMSIGQQVPILPKDNDWVHMQTMKPVMGQVLQQGNAQLAQIGLQHYAAHWNAGVAKKGIPDDQINQEKSYIAGVEKVIEQLQQKQQIGQMQQQAQQAGIPTTPQPEQPAQ